MSDNTKAITFWNFLKENTIEIPIIQRDYAQGRLGKENLRKNFLADLKNALDSNETMKLDFVYGSIGKDYLNPLDGQQRLTTLWLLHWYIALRAGELSEENCKIFKKITYETRISSREFCQNLCVSEYFKNFEGNDIVGFITKQTWFYSAWKQDPTIQSMLRMLGGTKIADKRGEDIIDGIEESFQETNEDGFKSYWEKLTQKEVIVFYHLPLKDFGLSDDLYIKMNARGKQLTNFENFKADLIGYITKQAEDNRESEWTGLLDAENGIPIKLDTDWTDIFWKNKSKESNIDEIYFAFINRYFLQELICPKKEEQTDLYSADNLENENDAFKYLYGEKGDDSRLQYSGLDKYLFGDGKTIPCNIFTSLSKTLNNLKLYLSGFKFFGVRCINTYFPIWVDSKFELIPKYDETGNITTLGQKERVVFLAVCRYFEKGNFKENSFQQWMRVVWNIVENGGIETISAMVGAMRLIDELSDSHDIYKFLKNDNKVIESKAANDQVKEERAKAKQILDENDQLRKYTGSHKKANGSDYDTWEEIIKEAESYTFFKGTIKFLFTNENWEVNNQSWCDFDTKWTNAQDYFNKGISTIEIAKYFSDEQIKDIFCRYSFNTKNWKSILIQKKISKPIHQFLLNESTNNTNVLYTDIKNILESINTQDVWLLQDWQCCNVILTNYSTRRSEPYNGYVFQVGNEIRNRWNNIVNGISEIEVRPPQAYGDEKIEINGQVYYRGLWTDIKYKNHFFRYFGNNTICLMTDDGGGKTLKNNNESDEPGNTYFFEVTEDFFNNNDSDNIILKNLNCLIYQALTGKKDETGYFNCPDKICE